VQEAHLGIQSDPLHRRDAVSQQERVEKREERVHSAERRPTGTSSERELVTAFPYERVEHVEVRSGRLTLATAQAIEVLRTLGPGEQHLHALRGTPEVVEVSGIARLPDRPNQDLTAVLDLASDDVPSDGRRVVGV
jgi:hypothetical protein